MDNNTNIQELKEIVKRFCDDRDWDQFHNAKDLSIAIINEAAELLDIFKYKSEKETEELFLKPEKRLAIAEEVSDVFYCLLRFSQKYNIDLSTELNKKMQKNAEKYPVEKARGSNKKYNEL